MTSAPGTYWYEVNPEKKPETRSSKTIKVLVLGAAEVGKSSVVNLLMEHSHGAFGHYKPTIWDIQQSTILNGKDALKVTFHDIGGRYAFPDILPWAIQNADIFVLVYSLEDPKSRNDVVLLLKDIATVRQESVLSLPVLIVANKLDEYQKKGLSRVFDYTKNGAFEIDGELMALCRNQVRVSAKFGMNTDAIKDKLLAIIKIAGLDSRT